MFVLFSGKFFSFIFLVASEFFVVVGFYYVWFLERKIESFGGNKPYFLTSFRHHIIGQGDDSLPPCHSGDTVSEMQDSRHLLKRKIITVFERQEQNL